MLAVEISKLVYVIGKSHMTATLIVIVTINLLIRHSIKENWASDDRIGLETNEDTQLD